MFRKKEDIRVREVQNAMGGEGHVFFHDWLLPEEAHGHGRVFSKVVIHTGNSIGVHKHEGEFEAFYVLSGVATVTDGDEVITLTAGDMHMCDNGFMHGVKNNEKEDLELLALIMKA